MYVMQKGRKTSSAFPRFRPENVVYDTKTGNNEADFLYCCCCCLRSATGCTDIGDGADVNDEELDVVEDASDNGGVTDGV